GIDGTPHRPDRGRWLWLRGKSGCDHRGPPSVFRVSVIVSGSLNGLQRALTCGLDFTGSDASGAQGHLHDAFALGTEEIERVLDVVEAEAMRDQRAEVDTVMLDHGHQPAHALLSPRAQRGHDALIAQAGVDGF